MYLDFKYRHRGHEYWQMHWDQAIFARLPALSKHFRISELAREIGTLLVLLHVVHWTICVVQISFPVNPLYSSRTRSLIKSS